ncbi:NADH-quinone oxidoreductase subunit K [Microvirga sp. SRT01]|jgi:multicomponent Na+:H+ antiporter subunit C|uniref:NADH-quinone oxidoreductase subunit K n=1 Tax=Sphingomonas longa TaxID=2778730 RepID=A0ABS2DBM3_9SPHN|nr:MULTISPECIES: sodium:proton antiporter [Alphaproteobacteria]MBM6577441.1 NADH-quinone oxidoreductase subunit K [Sphingomonas sp. BT552]MBR7710486.1 NADH-quinone oxidoreductase subunit K [Microvirga sp. SRT01]
MTILYAFCAAAIMGAALYMILSRNLVRILLGLALLSTGVNVMLFVAGDFGSRQPPLIRAGEKALGEAADPLAQALILTAIVIGFALTVVLATIVVTGWRSSGSLDARDLDAAEQPDDPEIREPHAD